MVPLQVLVDEGVLRRLKVRAAREGVSMSVLLRPVIERLAAGEEPVPVSSPASAELVAPVVPPVRAALGLGRREVEPRFKER